MLVPLVKKPNEVGKKVATGLSSFHSMDSFKLSMCLCKYKEEIKWEKMTIHKKRRYVKNL